MKKSSLSIGCQTLLRETETQTVPWCSNGFDVHDEEFRDHTILSVDGFVSVNDVISALYIDILRKDIEPPLQLQDRSFESVQNELTDHRISCITTIMREHFQRKIAVSEMNSWHKMDLKRHLLHEKQNETSKNDKSLSGTIDKPLCEIVQFRQSVARLGALKPPSFRGNRYSTESCLTSIQRKALAKKLDYVNSALESISTVHGT